MPRSTEKRPTVMRLVIDTKSAFKTSIKCCLEFIIKQAAVPFIKEIIVTYKNR